MDNGANTIYFSDTVKSHLLETARWTRFIAIIYFIAIALSSLSVLFFAAFGSSMAIAYGAPAMNPIAIILFCFIMIGLIIAPTVFLYNFSTCLKAGIANNNQLLIEKALRFQKLMYKFCGIVIIAFILLYILLFFVGAMGFML